MSVTAEQAIASARVVATERGWPWVEPVWAVRQRGGFGGLGRAHWRVVSNARQNGNNVVVLLDETTGRARDASFVRVEAAPGPPVTEFRAAEIAREVAASEGWPWIEPASVVRMRPGRLGTGPWQVKSNARAMGTNVSVVVDATTGAVLSRGYSPR